MISFHYIFHGNFIPGRYISMSSELKHFRNAVFGMNKDAVKRCEELKEITDESMRMVAYDTVICDVIPVRVYYYFNEEGQLFYGGYLVKRLVLSDEEAEGFYTIIASSLVNKYGDPVNISEVSNGDGSASDFNVKMIGNTTYKHLKWYEWWNPQFRVELAVIRNEHSNVLAVNYKSNEFTGEMSGSKGL